MKRLVLAGAGHAHAQVLLDWARAPLPGVELVLVSPQALAPYSGMVPGWLAGQYRFDEIAIHFQHLCAIAGARWVADELHALDADRGQLQLGSGQTLAYDTLSLNLGSTLLPPPGDTPVLSLRPLAALREHYEALLARWAADPSTRDFTVTAVGGGAAGVESLLAVLSHLRRLRPDRRVQGALVTRGASLLPDMAACARQAVLQALARADVRLQLGTAWCSALAQGSDLLLWATGAQAHAWQQDTTRRGTLDVSPAGFVRVDTQLRSTSHPQVFAVGDCAEWSPRLPKAGVYAVRMGPVLSHNLRAALGQGQLKTYQPQRHFLALLATADGRAIASRGRLGLEGRWVARWKDRIDRRFVARWAAQP
jgi:pyridine nucleotide-disulfide oxidoreductase family protein